jgi:uncharacterized protein (TIGR04255 family)
LRSGSALNESPGDRAQPARHPSYVYNRNVPTRATPKRTRTAAGQAAAAGTRYARPPIKEAVCEFRFEPRGPWDLAAPGLLSELLKRDFPQRRQGRGVETELVRAQDTLQQRINVADVLRLVKDDGSASVQISPHRLGVSQLPPYPGWSSFLPAIQLALSAYRRIVEPEAVARVGLRYINEVVLHGARTDPESYFDFYPFLGEKLPQDYLSCMAGAVLPFEDNRDLLRLQLVGTPGGEQDTALFTIDLDYFLNRAHAVDLEAVPAWLTQAHKRVEDAFEGLLKEPVRRIFRGEV